MQNWIRGCEEFNQGRPYEAHQFWEVGWQALPEPERSRVKGLIQACGVLVHLGKGRTDPALRLCRKARVLLATGAEAPGLEASIQVPGLSVLLAEIEARLEQGASAGQLLAELGPRLRALRAVVR